MKNVWLLILILLVSFNFLKAQTSTLINAEINADKKYQIKTGTQNVGELVLEENNNKSYRGFMIYTFHQGNPAMAKGFIGRLLNNPDQIRKKENLVVKNELSDSLTKRLMLKLEAAGIEKLSPCEQNPECAKLTFLDGDFTEFSLTNNGITKEFDYASIGYPITKYPEKIQLRKQVQNLISICIAEIDYPRQFNEAIKKLKRGSYYIGHGIGYLTFKKK